MAVWESRKSRSETEAGSCLLTRFAQEVIVSFLCPIQYDGGYENRWILKESEKPYGRVESVSDMAIIR